ncbi:hypothetical protein MKX50_14100 [Paenibacillus sp. FSL W8-0186]|uniref:hypothetical protein n=1 Tax=Paenibacillus sp. FSL W8-0186 TaxID=2921709 RepID=UPI0030CEF212
MKQPVVSYIKVSPDYGFENTKIVIRMRRYDWDAIRDFVAGNFRNELLHGVLYALLGYSGEGEHPYIDYNFTKWFRAYKFTPWLNRLGVKSGAKAILALKNWQRFFMKESINGVDYLFGIPHPSIPDNAKIFTRRALNLETGQMVREGTMEDIRVFTQMLNLYLEEALVKWVKSSCKVKILEQDESVRNNTTVRFDGTFLRIYLPADVLTPWSNRFEGHARCLELHYSVPQLGTLIYMMMMYSFGLLDISKGLARQFSDLRLSITTTRFMDDETQFEEDNGTRLIKMKVGGISYLALFRFRSSVWYILNLQEGRVISTEDAEYRVLLDALGVR